MCKSCRGEWMRGPANLEFGDFSCGVVCHCTEVDESLCGEWTRWPANAEFNEFSCGVVCKCAEVEKSFCGG